MSLHNLATVFGPTLLRPSEVESKAHVTSAADIWSHDVMAQVPRPPSTAQARGWQRVRQAPSGGGRTAQSPRLFPHGKLG